MDNPIVEEGWIEVFGARAHNLKNIDVAIPRNKLVVITGLSGSGKSSLAFDTIYAEGQRRYMESFSAYARQFLGKMERPDVDKITGLSPVISIEQKTTNMNPRSTVGTITEIYDFLRLLYARAGDAISYNTGEKMVRLSDDQILNIIIERFSGKTVNVLAPLVKARKGHYRDLFEQYLQLGYLKMRINGELIDLKRGMQLDRYKTHDIELLVDRLSASNSSVNRLSGSIQTAMKLGKGTIMIIPEYLEQRSTNVAEIKEGEAHFFSRHLMCPTTGISYDEPAPNTFSFNSPYGACKKCNGIGTVPEIDINSIIPDPKISINNGGISPLGKHKDTWIFKQIAAIGKKYNFTLASPVGDIPEEAINQILYGSDELITVSNTFAGITQNHTSTFDGLVNFIQKQHDEAKEENHSNWTQRYMMANECPECKGTRLRKESLWFKIDGKSIAEAAEMDITDLQIWMKDIDKRLSKTQNQIAGEVLKEIRKRIEFLMEVGLDYLRLNRPTRSLSGGESQRIRLASQIGSQLVGVLYILDEPSIGLHQRDNIRLIKSLQHLRDIGNSVIVVEHDKETIMAADYVLDIGPGAGIHGGKVIAKGTPAELNHFPGLTTDYLSGRKSIEIPAKRRKGNGNFLEIRGATGHNLKNVDMSFPLGKLICVTGVSGSGKSTLIKDTIYPILNQYFYRSIQKPLPYFEVDGLNFIDKVIEIDQSPIGRTPRSNPATYTGVFTDIRNLFAQLPEAKVRGYKPGRFSFNVADGRCETCLGGGMKVIEMNFLPDVLVVCETCKGKRFKRETLEVRYKGKSISDVLEMSIDHAVEFFSNLPSILNKIKTMKEIGLGYITLGQQSTTLSGGEAQRVKLATELSKRDTGKTFYILDEPTTGLHFEDVKVLLDVLNKLVDKGNTVLVIEHNMDVIKVADFIIDLGPEGGERGGTIVATGTPEEIIRNKKSITAKFLKKEMDDMKLLKP